jgi:hypothetical protein
VQVELVLVPRQLLFYRRDILLVPDIPQSFPKTLPHQIFALRLDFIQHWQQLLRNGIPRLTELPQPELAPTTSSLVRNGLSQLETVSTSCLESRSNREVQELSMS